MLNYIFVRKKGKIVLRICHNNKKYVTPLDIHLNTDHMPQQYYLFPLISLYFTVK